MTEMMRTTGDAHPLEPRVERGHASSLHAAELGVAEEPACDRFAVLCFADLEHTTDFVMRFVEALGERGCAHELDRFGEMELWVCSHGPAWRSSDSGPSAIYASEGAVRAFEELSLNRTQIGWVDATGMPPNRLLVLRYAPERRSAA